MHRRVGGYNIDALLPPALQQRKQNMAQLLVGSEGTLAFTRQLTLRLQPIPTHKVLGICHFSSFYQSMESTQHIVGLAPDAVELVDRTMIDLALDIPIYRRYADTFFKG
ncbi:MAG: hypothetical protein CM1200mP18_18120 [Gammaproteobacteria bacterium]|nr:MAG: hypothetical protein CM1200mP18_18120 [Gammaproteobacteria bacterium]